ncbi:hypothetical protein [Pantoea sp. LMR881]|uniref:hypothetical protein n=1 Tax=Pantoea sp. LMR881 TaxID=3014336 RepID=UPI003FA72CD8
MSRLVRWTKLPATNWTAICWIYGRAKLTVVFVTHSIQEAVFLSQRVIMMAARPGRVVDDMRIETHMARDDEFRVSQAFTQYAQQLQRGLLAASQESK